jgi:hypothetical protein
MLPAALSLAFTGLSLPAQLATVSSEDHTEEQLLAYRPPPPEDEFERHFSLEARFGLATPTGALGVAGEFSIIPQLGLGCGVGLNLDGTEYGCWLRTRPVLNEHRAFTVSSGVSFAPFTQNDLSAGGVFGFFTSALASGREGPGPPDRAWKEAYWLNTDLGYESRRGAFLFRIFGGAAVLLNPSAGVVQASDSADAEPPVGPLSVLLYAGVGIGFTK